MPAETTALFPQVMHCIKTLGCFITPALIVLLPVRLFTKTPSFVFRKMLHCVAFTGISLMIIVSKSWQAAALISVLLAAALYPLLALLENAPWFGNLLVEKSAGEIKRSFLLLMIMFAALISVSWGIFGQPHLAAASILMWGTGDAAAALIGIPFGKHKVHSRFTDGRKSWEGSAAMLVVSFVSGMIILLAVQKTGLSRALVIAGLGALAGTITELVSPSEYDTVTVPAVIITVLLMIGRS